MVNIYNTFRTKRLLLDKVSSEIVADITNHPQKDILLLLSGGSAFEVCDPLAKKLGSIPHNLSIGLLDERYDKSHANLLDFKKTDLYDRLKKVHKGIDNAIDSQAPSSANALFWNRYFKKVLRNNTRIVAVMGMGIDGHTAGIMPYPEDRDYFYKTFVNTARYATSYMATGKNEFPERVTTTIPLLLKINHAFCYITGINKSLKLKEALQPRQQLYKVPFSVINQMKLVDVYTDCEIN